MSAMATRRTVRIFLRVMSAPSSQGHGVLSAVAGSDRTRPYAASSARARDAASRIRGVDVAVEVADEHETEVVGPREDAPHVGGPTAPSAARGPIGMVTTSRPPERSAHDACSSTWSTSSASQPVGWIRTMTSREPVSTSSAAMLGWEPVKSISTGAKPTARAHRDSRDRVPPSSTMTALRRPSSLTRTIAASAPRADHADTLSSAHGRPRARGEPTGVVGLLRLAEHVGGEHPARAGRRGARRRADGERRRPARPCVGPGRRRGGPRPPDVGRSATAPDAPPGLPTGRCLATRSPGRRRGRRRSPSRSSSRSSSSSSDRPRGAVETSADGAPGGGGERDVSSTDRPRACRGSAPTVPTGPASAHPRRAASHHRRRSSRRSAPAARARSSPAGTSSPLTPSTTCCAKCAMSRRAPADRARGQDDVLRRRR